MSDLVKRLRALTAKQIEDNLDYILEADKLSLEAAAEIVRITAERDAALAKLAQYEQAPVAGWVCDDFIQDPCGSASCHNCGKRRREHIIARPEASHDPA